MNKIHPTTYHSTITVLNMTLVLIMGLLLLYYVMVSNSITAKYYVVRMLEDKVVSVVGISSILTSQKLQLEDMSFLQNIAEEKNMLKATNITYIFEGGNVAQR